MSLRQEHFKKNKQGHELNALKWLRYLDWYRRKTDENCTVSTLIKAPQEPHYKQIKDQLIIHWLQKKWMAKLFSGTTELNIKQHLDSRKKNKMKKNKWNGGVGREGSSKYFHFLVVLHCGTFYLELCRKLMFNYWKHNSSHSTAKTISSIHLI